MRHRIFGRRPREAHTRNSPTRDEHTGAAHTGDEPHENLGPAHGSSTTPGTVSAIGTELAGIIRYGAGMLDDVEEAVRRCRTDRDPGADLAKTCGTLVSGYLALRTWLSALPRTAMTVRVDQLLNYALTVTDQASLLAFRARDEHWQQLADQFGDGLGAPAAELRSLADLSSP